MRYGRVHVSVNSIVEEMQRGVVRERRKMKRDFWWRDLFIGLKWVSGFS